MERLGGTCEIVEAKEELITESSMNEKVRKYSMPRQGRVYSIEDDINQLFDSVNIKSTVKAEVLQRNPMKRPIRVNPPRASGVGASESLNLKQALRGLSISHASEMAAVKKRSLKAAGSSRVSDLGTMKQLGERAVVEANGASLSTNEGERNLIEVSFPGKIMANISKMMPDSFEVSAQDSLEKSIPSPQPLAEAPSTSTKMARMPSTDKILPLPAEPASEKSNAELVGERNLKLRVTLHGVRKIRNVLQADDVSSSKANASGESAHPIKVQADILDSEPCPASSGVDKTKSTRSGSPCLSNPLSRKKKFSMSEAKRESNTAHSTSHAAKGTVDSDLPHNSRTGKLVSKDSKVSLKHGCETSVNITGAVNSEIANVEISSSVGKASVNQTFGSAVKGTSTNIIAKVNDRSRSRDNGEFSYSSKGSIGEYSSSTSEESSASGSSRCCSRPHMSKDMRWDSIHDVQRQHGFLSLKHFKLLRRLGSGDIGTVYLAELVDSNCLFALKVMDNEFLARRKKLMRVQMEREILQMLDHPFLPTLYAHFTTDKLSCLVMEYCPGGDLHVIRQKQPNRCFSEQAARFYIAEVLLALEYLHMVGVVYRDLKPENLLVREDGHIMLTDFDLSLRCAVNPTLLRSSSPVTDPTKKMSSNFCSESSCIDPFCLQPSCQLSCFSPRLLTTSSRTRKPKSDQAAQITPLPQLVVEPTDARSNSFVGTHEYLAPEIIKGEGHGSAVDWWTYGIFLYELLYGKTPFKGATNEETLANVVSLPLKFPAFPLVSFYAKDLIRGLLIKQPENRLGFVRGAAEIKQHPFFEGLNWALIRCAVPPERPRVRDIPQGLSSSKSENSSKHIEFELF